MIDLLWSIVAKITGKPVVQLRCPHPPYARDARMDLLPEENGMDFYEVCLNCGKEWRDD